VAWQKGLELDYCEEHRGFWLDKGEEDRVIAVMKEEVKRTAQEFTLEAECPQYSRV
jgi:Zn-finger nucleic acid-binding protein